MKTTSIFGPLFALAAAGLLAQELHAAPGDLDSLDPAIGRYDPQYTSAVYATAVQRDGKIIIGGIFTSVLGVPRTNIARLNADGTLDAGFNPTMDPQGEVTAIALQPDGKILIAGVGIGGTRFIARYNVDGLLDAGFNPNPNGSVLSVVVQKDGKVLLGGFFTTLQPNGAAAPTTRNYIARVNADGTLDTTFDPDASFYVYSMALQTDGKVLLGGMFTTLQPNGAAFATTRHYVARVNSDGTLDTTFNPNPNYWVFSVALQADGKVLLGGDFTTVQANGALAATARQNFARVNADGSLDTGFDPSPNGRTDSIAVLADGTMLLGGYFTTLQPNGAASAQARSHIAHVNADGTLDTAFNPNANNNVHSLAVQADGRVILGGEFTALQPNGAPNPTTRSLFARLLDYPAAQTIQLASLPHFTTQITWHRTGATPELTRVTFELSNDDGATFGSPFAAVRSGGPADWQATFGLSLANFCRARGYVGGGQHNASSCVIEQVLRFGSDTRAPIPGLFNSGVDSMGTPLSQGEADAHYVLLGPSPTTGAPNAATAAGGYPIPPWLADNAASAWINPSTGNGSAPGDYFYQTTFDLTGRDLSTASISGSWAVDDAGADILLNGASKGLVNNNGFSTWTPFSITNGFVAGLNTLTFKVHNGGTSASPTGLRVEMAGLATAALQMHNIQSANNSLTVSWIAQPGVTYRVQSKAGLSDASWTDMPDDVVATGATASKTISVGTAASGFYRVSAQP